MVVLVDGELALRAGVPDLDVSVEGSSDDLSVISGKGNGENVLLVANQLGDGSASGNVPKADGTVPRGGESETGVTGELDLADEVGVASHHLSGHAPGLVLVLITHWVESPLDESLIAGAGEEEFFSLSVNFLFTNGEGGNPTTVTYVIKKRDKFRSALAHGENNCCLVKGPADPSASMVTK